VRLQAVIIQQLVEIRAPSLPPDCKSGGQGLHLAIQAEQTGNHGLAAGCIWMRWVSWSALW
jgi:hypothetical protein